MLLFALSASAVQGQGTLNFNSRLTAAGIDAPVTYEGVGVLGPDYLGQLFAFDGSSYEPVGSAVAFQSNILLAGYVNGGLVTVAGAAPGQQVTLVLRAWNSSAGEDWTTASASAGLIWGQSDAIDVVLGGTGSPPSLPANLSGLQGFAVSGGSLSPVLLSQPLSVQVDEGGDVQFSVEAGGIQPLFYQWRKDGVLLPGATGSTLSVGSAARPDDGVYEVVVSNEYGSAVSDGAVLTVLSPMRYFADGVEVAGSLGVVDSVVITLAGPHPDWPVYFTLDGSPVSALSQRYSGEFVLSASAHLRAVAFSPDLSQVVEAGALIIELVQTQTIQWGAIAGLAYGDSVDLVASASSGLPVVFDVVSGPAVISGARLTVIGVGDLVLRAVQSGNGEYAAVQVEQNIVIARAQQSLSWPDLPDRTFGDGPYVVDLTSSSGLPVDVSIVQGNATLSGGMLTLNGAGVVTVRGEQAGDENNAPVVETRTFTVAKAMQTLEFGAVGALRYGGDGAQLSATSSAGLGSVAFEVISGPAVVSGNVLTPTGVGSVLVQATQAGDENHLSATAEVNISVERGVQTITWDGADDLYFPSESLVLTGSASSGLGLSYEVLSGPASIQAETLNLEGAGEVLVRAVQAGNELWEPAEYERVFTVTGLTTLTVDAGLGGGVTLDPVKDYYLPTDIVRVTAEPGEGFTFSGWQGDTTGFDNPLVLNMTADRSISAMFSDVAAPSIALGSPVSGSTPNREASLSGGIQDNVGVVRAYWEMDGVFQDDLALTEGLFGEVNISLNIGENRIRVVAVDAVGNESFEEVLLNWEPLHSLRLLSPDAVQEGEMVRVPVEVQAQGNVGMIRFVIDYNADYLKEPVMEWAAAFSGAAELIHSDIPGRLELEIGDIDLPIGSMSLGAIEFRTRSVPYDLGTEVSGTVVLVADTRGEPIGTDVYCEAGVVTIEERAFAGDNNANRRLDVGDSAMIQRLVSGLEEMRAWDVSRNDLTAEGVLDEADVLEVLRTVVGIRPQPVELGGDPMLDGVVQLVLESDKRRLRAGETVTIQVKIDGVTGDVYGASFRLDYDPRALWLVDASSHSLAASLPEDAMGLWNVHPAVSDYGLQSGTVAVAASSSAPWQLVDGVVATLTFAVQPGMAEEALWPVKLSSGEVALASFETVLTETSTLELRGLAPEFHPAENVVGEGLFQMVFEGADQHSYVVESASSLSGPWVPISVNLTTEAAAIQFIDEAVGSARFYRIRLVE